MYGKSFVLVKPDGMNKEIKDEIIQTIQNRSISVVKQQKICLTVSDIENIWPYTQSDIVSRQLFMNYLLDKVCLLLYLESSKESLYKDIAAIKKKFRNRYGVHQYLSIMHTPGSYEEYMKDMIVFQKKSKGFEKNNTIIGSFKCYDKLNKCDIVRLCEKIEKYLNGDYKKIIRERENKQFLVVYKNGVNDSYFMVGILGDYLNYSFEGCRMRYRSVKSVFEEIKYLYQNYNIRKFCFWDDNFIIPGKRGIERCRELVELIKSLPEKISLELETRACLKNKNCTNQMLHFPFS